MSASIINDPQHWRDRAKEARAIADEMNDRDAKQMMLGIARSYILLAERAEARAMGSSHCGYASGVFRGMMEFVFDPPLRLAREVTVRTLDDAAEFARTYVGPRLPHRRDRIVRRLEEVSDDASARIAAQAFRAWAIAEGLLAEEN